MTFTDDSEAAEDWTGRQFSCQDCLHQKLREGGRCVLGRICVRDKRARRIDGFFANNPEYAGDYLDHLYFEVRALAAKYANPFQLARLMKDPEAEVRAVAALKLPLVRVRDMRNDKSSAVRQACALRLEGADLVAMAGDENDQVRLTVARRLDPRCCRCFWTIPRPASVGRSPRASRPTGCIRCCMTTTRWCAAPPPNAHRRIR